MYSRTVVVLLLLVAIAAHVRGYSTSGNKILDKNGNPILLRGIARPSLEWAMQGENISIADFTIMSNTWKANCVRLSLNQCFWLSSSAYQSTVLDAVNKIKALGMGVILDLHWSEGTSPGNCNQRTMADNNSVLFWRQVAAAYKNDGMVAFELYNEPYTVSWPVWRSGGDAGGFTSPGMQGLLDAVRGTGANNLVIIGGLNYAFDLSNVTANLISGSNIAYCSHPYNFGGKQPSDWDNGFGNLAARYPIVLTEFGSQDCGTSYVSSLMDYCERKEISWTAWGWYPGGCNFPALINNWAADPSAPGAIVRNYLQTGKKVPSGTSTTAPTTTAPTTAPTTTKSASTTTTKSATTAPTTTTTKSASGTKISVNMNQGCNQYWIAVDSFTGCTQTTTQVQFKDSSSGASWVTGAAQNWNTGNAVGWAWSAGRVITFPVSLLLTSSTGSTVTLTNVIGSVASSVTWTSNGQYP